MARAADRAVGVFVGARFGRWTVVGSPFTYRKHSRSYVPCRCDCGTERDVPKRYLLKGVSQSCRCRMAEVNDRLRLQHGHARNGNTTREYRRWQKAKQTRGEQRDFVTWLRATAA